MWHDPQHHEAQVTFTAVLSIQHVEHVVLVCYSEVLECNFECFDASVFNQLQHFKVLLLLSWLLFDVLFMKERNASFIVQNIDQVLAIEIRSSYFSVTFEFIDRCIEMDVVIRWFRFFLLRIFQDRDQTIGCFFARWRLFSSSSVVSFSCLRRMLWSCSCISSSIGFSRFFSTLLLLPSFFRQGKYIHLPHDGSSTFEYIDSLGILQRPNFSKRLGSYRTESIQLKKWRIKIIRRMVTDVKNWSESNGIILTTWTDRFAILQYLHRWRNSSRCESYSCLPSVPGTSISVNNSSQANTSATSCSTSTFVHYLSLAANKILGYLHTSSLQHHHLLPWCSFFLLLLWFLPSPGSPRTHTDSSVVQQTLCSVHGDGEGKLEENWNWVCKQMINKIEIRVFDIFRVNRRW